jgi:hypothetical protein
VLDTGPTDEGEIQWHKQPRKRNRPAEAWRARPSSQTHCDNERAANPLEAARVFDWSKNKPSSLFEDRAAPQLPPPFALPAPQHLAATAPWRWTPPSSSWVSFSSSHPCLSRRHFPIVMLRWGFDGSSLVGFDVACFFFLLSPSLRNCGFRCWKSVIWLVASDSRAPPLIWSVLTCLYRCEMLLILSCFWFFDVSRGLDEAGVWHQGAPSQYPGRQGEDVAQYSTTTLFSVVT